MADIFQDNLGIKRRNLQKVLRFVLEYGPCSRLDVSKALHLSMPTVQQNIRLLQEQGLIVEIGQFDSTGGRKAGMFTGNRSAVCSLGIDITRNHINLALVGLNREIIHYERIKCLSDNSPEYYLRLKSIIDSFVQRCGKDAEPIRFAGVSLPGILDPEQKHLIHSYVIKPFDCNAFRSLLPWPCIYENDANAAGLAELTLRRSENTFAYLSLSNSVGGSVFIDGHLLLGSNRRCGEFGHMRIVPGGRLCTCGKQGCLDSYCSALRLAEAADGDLELFFQRLSNRDPRILPIWESYLDKLMLAITSLRMAFDCDVVLGGYVGGHLEPFMPEIRERLTRLDTFKAPADYVSCCKFTLSASACGAALQPLNRYINEI